MASLPVPAGSPVDASRRPGALLPPPLRKASSFWPPCGTLHSDVCIFREVATGDCILKGPGRLPNVTCAAWGGGARNGPGRLGPVTFFAARPPARARTCMPFAESVLGLEA